MVVSPTLIRRRHKDSDKKDIITRRPRWLHGDQRAMIF